MKSKDEDKQDGGQDVLVRLKHFGQGTTWHGIKQIAESGNTSRTLSWLIVVLGALAAFSYAITTKIIEYYDYKSQIEIQTTYPGALAFPRVTICNTSPYKMSRVVEAGLYDTLVETIKAASALRTSDYSGCEDYYLLTSATCPDPEQNIFSFTYREVTNRVCSRLCTEHEPVRCAGYLYNTKTRVCILSSATGDSGPACVRDNGFKYYEKHRCVEYADITCDLEQGSLLGEGRCQMYPSAEDEDDFILVKDSDHTLVSPEGHYLYLLDTDKRHGYRARIETPFVQLDQNCIQVFYKNSGLGDVRVVLRAQNLSETYLPTSNSPGDASDWRPLFVNIPYTGIYQVIVEAVRQQPPNGDYSVYSGVSVDDLRIMSCSNFSQENCRTTWTGKEYMGSMTTTQSGATCRLWNQSLHLLDGDRYYFQNTDDINSNFCRNPISGYTPPWCFVNDKGRRESCNVALCPCREGWFTCEEDGLCIPADLVCNGVRDCYQGSDESSECEHLIDVNCGFETGFMCGYLVFGSSSLQWEPTETFIDVASGDRYSMHLEYDVALPGSQAIFLSPSRTFQTQGAVTFYLSIHREPFDEITALEVKLIQINGSDAVVLTIMRVDKTAYLVCVPDGTFSLLFLATLGSSSRPDIILDNIQWHHRNEIYNDRTIEEHCNYEWPPRPKSPTHTHLTCTFDEDNCGTNNHRSSNFDFRWEHVPASRIVDEAPVPSRGACEATYNDIQSGIITSPGYPVGYPSNVDCYIRIEQGSAPLALIFTDIQLQPSDSCEYDYVEIYDAFNTSDVVIKSCGPSLPPNVTTYFVTTIIHFHSDYSYVDRGYSVQFNIERKRLADPAIGLIYMGDRLGFPLVQYLSLPKVTIDKDFCLAFHFLARHTTELFRSTSLISGTAHKLMETLLDYPIYNGNDTWLEGLHGLGPAWHRILIQLSAYENENAVLNMITYVSASSRVFATGIDNLHLQPGLCENKYDRGQVECNFTDSEQCGYIDISSGPNKWLRGYNSKLDEYRMFTILNRVPMASAVLLTPPASIDQPSCLHIALSYTGLAVSMRVSKHLSPDVEIVPLRIFDLLDLHNSSELIVVEIYLDAGHYRLNLEAQGWGSSISIQYIMVKEQPCTSYNISAGVKGTLWSDVTSTNSIRTVDDRTTPISTQLPDTLPTYPRIAPDTYSARVQAYSTILADWINDQDGVDVMDLVMGASHHRDDTILRCTWDGRPCNESLITETITDMGHCLVFNSDINNGMTAKTSGAEKGLRLLINIADYEQIGDITSERGIKVLLDHQNDEQDMSDRALGISAGTHALVSVTYSQEHLLRPEWGSCGELELPYYANKTYTYNRCKSACAITSLVQKCNCGAAYMTGQSTVCDMKMFFECIIPTFYSGNVEPDAQCNECISACLKRDYSTSLSSTMLSGQVLCQVSEDLQIQMQSNYKRATELKHRVSWQLIQETLEFFKRVNSSLTKIEDYAEFNLLDFRTSVIGRAEQVIAMFDTYMAEDYDRIYSIIPGFQSSYDNSLSGLIQAILSASTSSTNSVVHSTVYFAQVQEFRNSNATLPDVQSFWETVGAPYYSSLYECARAMDHLRSLGKSRIFSFPDLFQVNTYVLPGQDVPQFLIAPHWKYDQCLHSLMTVLPDSEGIIIKRLTEFDGSVQPNDQHIIAQPVLATPIDMDKFFKLADQIKGIHDNVTANQALFSLVIKKCMLHYREFLDSAHVHRQSYASQPLSYSSVLNPAKTLASLRQSILAVDSLYKQFSANEIGVVDLAYAFKDVQTQIEFALLDINSRLQQHIITPMLGALEEYEQKYSRDVLQLLDDAVMLINYLPNQTQHITKLVKSASLWQLPVAQLNNKHMFKMTFGPEAGSEVIEVGLEVFLNTSAESVVKGSLRTFFSSIHLELQETFSELLNTVNTAGNLADSFAWLLGGNGDLDIFARQFIGDNILQLDIYYSDLGQTDIIQTKAYDALAFFSDFGGYMGLLLGASIISLVELIDWVIFNCLLTGKSFGRSSSKDKRMTSELKAERKIASHTNSFHMNLDASKHQQRASGFHNGVYVDDGDTNTTLSYPNTVSSTTPTKVRPKYNIHYESNWKKSHVAASESETDSAPVGRQPDYFDEHGNQYYI